MQLFFRVKQTPEPVVPNLGSITLSLLEGDPAIPFTIKQLNDLPENIKKNAAVPNKVVRHIIASLYNHIANQDQFDDITMLGLYRKQEPEI